MKKFLKRGLLLASTIPMVAVAVCAIVLFAASMAFVVVGALISHVVVEVCGEK